MKTYIIDITLYGRNIYSVTYSVIKIKTVHHTYLRVHMYTIYCSIHIKTNKRFYDKHTIQV